MKKQKIKQKILLLWCFVAISNSYAMRPWDQSLSRWLGECKIDMPTRCHIAGRMYENGHMVKFNGEYNVETKMKKNIPKAIELYKKSCRLGDIEGCKDYQRLTHKIIKPKSQDMEKITQINNKEKFILKSSKDSCTYTIQNKKRLINTSCLKMINSKGIKIVCTSSKKICKTQKELFEFAKNI